MLQAVGLPRQALMRQKKTYHWWYSLCNRRTPCYFSLRSGNGLIRIGACFGFFCVCSLCFLNVQAEKLVPTQLLYFLGEGYITSVKVGKGWPCRNCSDWREILILEWLEFVGHSRLPYAPYQLVSLFSRLFEFFCFAACSGDWSRQMISQKLWFGDTWEFFGVFNSFEQLFHCRDSRSEDASWIMASFFFPILFL